MGCDLQFKGGKFKIMRNYRSVIASSKKAKGNIFHLNFGTKNCLIAQVDKSWLWHKGLCHVNFDNILKISFTHILRDLPRFMKPISTL
jgi:hypothetical protein